MKRLALAVLTVAAMSMAAPTAALAAPGPVTIPADYVYEPSRGSLHDYCTSSEDVPVVFHRYTRRSKPVDFRGPCARHDMCYEGDRSKASCDDAFRRDMYQQCDHTFTTDSGFRSTCHQRADLYYDAVVRFGDA